LTWPDLFSAQAIFNALRTAQSRSDHCVSLEWLDSPNGRRVIRIANDYEASVMGQWETGSMWAPVAGHPKAWGVLVSRNGERRSVIFSSYPMKQFYTDAELTALTVQEVTS